jgi:hypothetical protein
MKIHHLNCTACGAPISVPDDVEQLNCSSCGSFLMIERGEGYIALKMVEEVSRVIEETSKDTQTAIQKGADATKAELRRLQIAQEISNLETQIESLRTEIRSLERQNQNRKTKKEIQSLYVKVFEKLDRVQQLYVQRAQASGIDPDDDLDTLQKQFKIIHEALVALKGTKNSIPPRSYSQARERLMKTAADLGRKIPALKVRNLKKSLKSFELSKPSTENRQELTEYLKTIQKVSHMPTSNERAVVLSELKDRYNSAYQRWENVETGRLDSVLVSTGVNPLASRSISEVGDALRLIQADIKTLQTWDTNAIQRRQLSELRGLERRTIRHLNRLRKRKRFGLENVWLPAVGFVAFFAMIWRSISGGDGRSGDSELQEVQPFSAVPHENITEGKPQTPQQAWLAGCSLALVPLLGLSCLGAMVFGSVASGREGASSDLMMGILFLVTMVGFIFGTYLFFRRTKPAAYIWITALDKSIIQPTGKKVSGYSLNRNLTGILGGLSLWVTIWLLFLGVSALFAGNDTLFSILLIVGFLLGPAASIWQYFDARKTRVT